MSDGGGFAARQVSFHENADEKRFHNRLANVFIAAKERRLMGMFTARLSGAARPRILEIGCGEGSNLRYLAEAAPGAALFGIDFSLNKTRFLRSVLPGAGLACADSLALPFKEGSFDAALIRDLLHHVNWARDEVIEEALRVVKPGGVAIIFESHGRTALNRIFQIVNPAEAGMMDSTPITIRALGQKRAQSEFEFVEASFLLRAAAYFLGWPSGPARYLALAVYYAIWSWEAVWERLAPESMWVYMMLALRK